MPTLVIDNVPASLLDRIQKLAKTQHRSPADTALEMLESAFRMAPAIAAAPSPAVPFLTEEIGAPFDIPWPKGEIVAAIEIAEYLPEPHDTSITE